MIFCVRPIHAVSTRHVGGIDSSRFSLHRNDLSPRQGEVPELIDPGILTTRSLMCIGRMNVIVGPRASKIEGGGGDGGIGNEGWGWGGGWR